MPSSHQAYNAWNPQFFEDKAALVGEHTLAYLQKLLLRYAYPEIGYKQCQGILSFARFYSTERLEKACQRALGHDTASYHTIERILKAGLDQVEDAPLASTAAIPLHQNIRGASEYR